MAQARQVSSPWNKSIDREAQRAAKREAVLHAAAEAFAENGYNGTSLDSIAARLGITKPTLCHYVGSKDDLIGAVAARALEQIMQAMAGDAQASALVQLQHFIRRYVEFKCTVYGRCWSDIRTARIPGEAGQKLRDDMRVIDGRIRELLELGQGDGSIAPCDVKITAFMIAGAIKDISNWYDEGGPHSPATIAEKFANQFAAGLAPRQG